MKCQKCGTDIPEGKIYCEKCGSAIQMVPDYNPVDDISIDTDTPVRSPIWKQFRNRILRNSLSHEKSTGSAGQLALFFWFLEGILPTRSHTVLLDQCRKQQKLKSYFLKSQNSVPVRAAIHIPFSLSCLILTGQMVLFTIHWMEVRRC